MLIISLLVALYLVLGFTFAAYNDGDMVLETIGRVIGLTFVALTFPYWISKVAYHWYLSA